MVAISRVRQIFRIALEQSRNARVEHQIDVAVAAAALLHEPEILFLDEPTSGADPLARREFWRRITKLSEQGVTVVVTTHFMEEAEYCDRIAIMDAGRVLAQGTPAEIRSHAHEIAGR